MTTIQRKYSLPNCTLVLEGLSDRPNDSQSLDGRPVLTILTYAECQLIQAKQTLTGGRDFFESLVTAVSGYAQEFLSYVTHPEAHNKETGLVQLQKIDRDRHRLIVQPESQKESAQNHAEGTTQEVELTTVQLFDLVEAVDQFFADTQTLPDLTLQLAPVSRRYVRSGQQLVKQAVPATVGASGLALAAIAFFLIPIPEAVRRPTEPTSPSAQSTNIANAPPITDPVQLVQLQQKLTDRLRPAWKPNVALGQDLVYRVGVAGDGAIKGYVATNDVANQQVQQTPLPRLLSQPVAGSATTPESLAQFQVTFTPKGEVRVQPWGGKK
jgi:Domain of unknown function (DUF4335)